MPAEGFLFSFVLRNTRCCVLESLPQPGAAGSEKQRTSQGPNDSFGWTTSALSVVDSLGCIKERNQLSWCLACLRLHSTLDDPASFESGRNWNGRFIYASYHEEPEGNTACRP
eukprot:463465-Rhodomonas_salina.1